MKSRIKNYIPMLCILIVGVILALTVKNNFYITSLIYIVLYMYFSSAWNILGGFTGLFALGNGLYIGIGAYICAVLFVHLGITPWIGMIIGGLAAGILSIIVGYPVFRLKGMYYALATIALMSIFELIFTNEQNIFGIYTGGSNGLRFTMTGKVLDMQFLSKAPYLITACVLLVIILIVSEIIMHSKMGFYFRSIRANSDAAASLGVPVLRYKLTAHFISAFFTGVGGAFYAVMLMYASSKVVFGMSLSFSIVLFCILGGANTLWGPIIGALIMVPIDRVLNIVAGSGMAAMSTLIYGLALCLVMLFMPEGIWGLIQKLTNKKKRQTVSPDGSLKQKAGGV